MDYEKENNIYMEDLERLPDAGGPEGPEMPDAGGPTGPGPDPVRPNPAPGAAGGLNPGYSNPAPGAAAPAAARPSFWKRHKGLCIFLIIACIIIAAGVLLANFANRNTVKTSGDTVTLSSGSTLDLSDPYIGVLSITGTIAESESESLLGGGSTYHHNWTLDMIDQMIGDAENKALILYVDSPGGSVYASDELYLKVKEYKEKTGRPVWAYMASMAASGGYYISAPADRIVANRNCWTGSIGVTLGTMYDVSELLEKLGVSTVTITSGENKAMGSYTEPMTKEQRQIFQSLIDEAYDQFVGIVAEGRNMPDKKVRKLADGRIYTAKQALENGLIDEISPYRDATSELQQICGSAAVKRINYNSDEGFLKGLLMEAFGGRPQTSSELSTVEIVRALMQENNTFTVTYLANIRK